MHRAQYKMTQLANKSRSERIFQIGDLVYVKLQPYLQNSVEVKDNSKLSPLYYRPYRILDKVGEVAYRLELLAQSQIHPTFHVSKLRGTVKSGQCVATSLPDGENVLKVLEYILDRKTAKRENREVTNVLVKWSNSDLKSATWEFLIDLQAKYPNSTIEDVWNLGSRVARAWGSRINRRNDGVKDFLWIIVNKGIVGKQQEGER